MRYKSLYPGGKNVSLLCLGTVVYGTEVSRADAFAQMDRYFEGGGNCIDTARMYSDWIPGGHNASEAAVGAWLRERRRRSDIFLVTKGGHPDLRRMDVPRLGKKELRADLEESLTILGVDYIDLYFVHRDDVSQSAAEILLTLEDFKKEGKILACGCSNWTLPRMKEADAAAKKLGIAGFVCDQIRYGLADCNRDAIEDKTIVVMDGEIYDYHKEAAPSKTVMAYTSMCKGYFSKRLAGRALKESYAAIYDNAPNDALTEKIKTWTKELNCTPAAFTAAYVSSQSFPAFPIAAFSSLAQLDEFLAAGDLVIPREILDEIAAVKKHAL
jgi:aryl-alcohol dehydrogenase-like predicted oxidoreductase